MKTGGDCLHGQFLLPHKLNPKRLIVLFWMFIQTNKRF